MMYLWEKVKRTLEEGAKSLDEATPASVTETATSVASAIVEKSKNLAAVIGEKSREVYCLGQLKLKHYNLNRQLTRKFHQIGARAFVLVTMNASDIYQDEQLKKLLAEAQKIENQINHVAAEIKRVQLRKIESKKEDRAEKEKIA